MFGTTISPIQLQDRIVDGAGRMAAAQCSWLLALADLELSGGGDACEFASTAGWLSWSCAIHAQAAKEYVAVGCALKTLPKVTEEFSQGRLSYSQVRLIVRVATETTEQSLIYFARNSTVLQLGLVIGRYRNLLEAEAAAAEHRRGRYLNTWFDPDGFFVLRGRLCPEDGAVVEAALRQAMDSLGPSSVGEPESPTADAFNHHGTRQADALVQIAQQNLSGTSPASAPYTEVVVHVDLESLAGNLGGECQLDCGVALAPATALRMACDAALVPLIEDRNGKPLSVGRRTRVIPTGLRRALNARDRGCRFPGCANRRYLHGHHLKHWARGGHTSIENLVELCTFHHRLVHEGGYRVKASEDGFEFFRNNGSKVEKSRICEAGYPNRLALVDGSEIAIEPGAIGSEWLGDPMNLSYAIGALFAEESRAP